MYPMDTATGTCCFVLGRATVVRNGCLVGTGFCSQPMTKGPVQQGAHRADVLIRNGPGFLSRP